MRKKKTKTPKNWQDEPDAVERFLKAAEATIAADKDAVAAKLQAQRHARRRKRA